MKSKIVITVAKMTLAIGLLAFVCTLAHWRDYAVGFKDDTGVKKDAKYLIFPGQPKDVTTLAVRETHWGLIGEVTSWGQELPAAPAAAFRSSTSKDPKPATTLAEATHPGLAFTLLGINKLFLVLGLLGFLVSWLVIAIRWWMLLKIQDIMISPWEAIRLTFLGQFFNRVIPGTVGGDLVKAYYVSRHTKKTAAVLVSMFVDRVMGLTEMTILAGSMVLVVLLAGLETFHNVRQPVYFITGIVALVMVAMTFLLSARFRELFHLQKLYGRLPIAHHFAAAGDAARLYRQRLPALAKAIAITFGAHFMWIGAIALLGYGLDIHVTSDPSQHCHWYSYFLYIPLIYIVAASIPIPGGAGSTELLYLFWFSTMAHMDPSGVLALALLARLVELFWSLPGLLVALTSPKMPKAKDMQAQLDREEQVVMDN
jgi:uncharacterized membrane protein YbhN (UPF0104 family)